MAGAKSAVVDILNKYILEFPSGAEYIPSRAMCFTCEDHDWQYVFPMDIYEMEKEKSPIKISLYNLLDACQYIHASMPGKDLLMKHIKWSSAARMVLKPIQKVIHDGQSIPKTITDCQKTIFAFDHGRHVSLAKKPTQNKRRISDVKTDSEFILPFEDPDDFVIKDHDVMPVYWKELCLFKKYSAEVNNYISKTVKKNIVFGNHKTQNFGIWRNGVFDFVNKDKTINHMNDVFKNIGEFDYFAIRYMDEIINQSLETRYKHHRLDINNSGPIPFEILIKIYDFSNIVFRIFSTDTDLLLLSLYFLEYIKFKHNIDVYTRLPSILVIHPWRSKKIIHVTNLFAALRHKLEMDNTFGDGKTMIRSFVIALMSCGNDLLPTPVNITFTTFHTTFVTLRSLMGQSLLTMNIHAEKQRYKNQCILHGQSFKMLYLLAYAEKLVLKKDKKDLWNYENDPEGLEQFIVSYIAKKNLQDKQKEIQGYGNIKARLVVINIMLYSIEHGLRTIKGSKKSSLADIILPQFTHTNLYQKYIERVKPLYHEKAFKLGMISERSCVFYTKNLKPNKKSEDEEVKELTKLAKNIFYAFHFGQYEFNRFKQQYPKKVKTSSSSRPSCSTDPY